MCLLHWLLWLALWHTVLLISMHWNAMATLVEVCLVWGALLCHQGLLRCHLLDSMIWIGCVAALIPERLVSLVHLTLVPLLLGLILHLSLCWFIDAGLSDYSVSVSHSVIGVRGWIWTIWIHGSVASAQWFNALVCCLPNHILQTLVHQLLWLSWVVEFTLLDGLPSLEVMIRHGLLGIVFLKHTHSCWVRGGIWLSNAVGSTSSVGVMRFSLGLVVIDHVGAVVVGFWTVYGLGFG